MRELLQILTPREREVMRLRLGFEEDSSEVLQEIGVRMHLSRERVRQIEIQALRKLKHAAKRRNLLGYLSELTSVPNPRPLSRNGKGSSTRTVISPCGNVSALPKVCNLPPLFVYLSSFRDKVKGLTSYPSSSISPLSIDSEARG